MTSGKRFRCGYVALLGKPNAGKSSLVNFFVGEEVAVVSHRQQTTRDQILGIKTTKDYQIIFVDTPGIHHSKNNLDRIMNKRVRNALAGADLILYLFDGTKEIDEEEKEYIKNLFDKNEKVILVETKIDKFQKNEQKTAKNRVFCEIEEKNKNFLSEIGKQNYMQISAVTGENVSDLEKDIVKFLPENSPIFDDDEFTDKSIKFLIAEKIRGILLQEIDKEIPHGIAVVITNFEEKENLTKIDAEIVCDRERHKGIIIGKGGANLKRVGEKARIYAEDLLGTKCMLKLFVKVDEGWRDKNVGEYYNL